MDIVTRKEARKRGLKRYFTGEPCKYGHLVERRTSTSTCLTCSIENGKKYYINNKDLMLVKRKAYTQIPIIKKRLAEYRKQYRLRHTQKPEVKEYRREYQKLYRKIHKEYYNFLTVERKAKKLRATPKWYDREKIRDIYKSCPQGFHVDHIIPLINDLVCGFHLESNLQYLTAEENLSKGNKFTSYSESSGVKTEIK